MADPREAYIGKQLERVAALIDDARKRRGLSSNELADFAGLSRGHLSRVLSGANLTVRTLAVLANALDVPLKNFFSDDEPGRPGPSADSRRPKRAAKLRS